MYDHVFCSDVSSDGEESIQEVVMDDNQLYAMLCTHKFEKSKRTSFSKRKREVCWLSISIIHVSRWYILRHCAWNSVFLNLNCIILPLCETYLNSWWNTAIITRSCSPLVWRVKRRGNTVSSPGDGKTALTSSTGKYDTQSAWYISQRIPVYYCHIDICSCLSPSPGQWFGRRWESAALVRKCDWGNVYFWWWWWRGQSS